MSVYSAVLDRIDVVGRRAGMLRQIRPTDSVLAAGMAAMDLLAVVIAVAVVTGLTYSPVDALGAGFGAGAVMTVVVASRGGYRRHPWGAPRQDVRTLLLGIATAGMVAVCLAYVELVHLPPQVLASAVVASAATAILARAVQQTLLRRWRERAGLSHRVLLIGASERFAPVLPGTESGETVLLGRCVPDPTGHDDDVLGAVEDSPRLVRELGADTVLVAAGVLNAEELRQLAWRLEPLGVSLLLVPDVTDVAAHRTELVPAGGTPMVRIALGPSATTKVLKAVLDRGLGALVALAALLVLVPAMVAVKITSPGPVFFRQTRVGENGVPFTMLKLRTMYVDAEERLAELVAHSDGNAVLFKMRHDPRVTPVGRTLRRFSIDELPQIWNVLRGEMSLVGPRPPLPREVAEYDDRAYHRLYAKPGLTGLWQVSGRSDLDWEESVRLDLYYVDNRNTQDDLKILARTAGAVLGGRGAY